MKTLYFHIGVPKTGTTALQQFFFRNREEFRARGVTYPELGLVGHCHHKIGASFYAPEIRPAYIQYPNTLTLEEYSRLLDQVDGDVLLSSELVSWGFFAKRLREVLNSNWRARIIVYLRRQDEYIMSRYSEDIKALETRTIEEYTEAAKFLDYRDAVLGGWSETWGAENILVRPYERDQFFEGSIFHDFLHHVFGWELTSDFSLPERDANSRLTLGAMEYKRAVNRLPLNDDVKCALAGPLLRFSAAEDASTTQAFVGHATLPPEYRARLLERYRESNAWIASTVLGRKTGELFHEDSPLEQGGWQPDGGLSVERVKDISLYLCNDSPRLWRQIRDAIVRSQWTEDGESNNLRDLLAHGLDQASNDDCGNCRLVSQASGSGAVTFRNAMKVIADSGGFRTDWYLKAHPDLAGNGVGANALWHYVTIGASEGRNPSPEFDGDAYLAKTRTVSNLRVNPFAHFQFHGKKAGFNAVRSRYVQRAQGWCPCCRRTTFFESASQGLRGHYRCSSCGSLPCERAIAQLLGDFAPGWYQGKVHTGWAQSLGISRLAPHCTSSFFDPAEQTAAQNGEKANQDPQALGFEDDSFDFFIALDTLAYLSDPATSLAEMMRVIRPGGALALTAPVTLKFRRSRPTGNADCEQRSEQFKGLRYIPAPTSRDDRTVTWRFGRDLPGLLTQWTGVTPIHRNDEKRDFGIEGEYVDVFLLPKG